MFIGSKSSVEVYIGATLNLWTNLVRFDMLIMTNPLIATVLHYYIYSRVFFFFFFFELSVNFHRL